MAVGSSPNEFWNIVNDVDPELGISEFVQEMALSLVDVRGPAVAAVALGALQLALAERLAKAELLVLEAEAIARSLPAAFEKSLTLGSSPRRHIPTPGTQRSDPGPLVDVWVQRLADACSDEDRVRRASEICVVILDDCYVRVVDDLQPFDLDINAIRAKLLHQQ